MNLTVVLPAYNEAGNLSSQVHDLVSEIKQFLDDFEILIVDDGSKDDTARIAEQLSGEDSRVRVIHHPCNMGYGAAQKTGFLHARKDWVIVVPADHQFEVRDIKKFMNHCHSYDIIGSYRIQRKDPFLRKVISKIYNCYLELFYRIPLRDVNWVKMYRRHIFERVNIESTGFAMDAELIIKAFLLGFKIGEVEVIHHPRPWGESSTVKISAIYRTAKELLKIHKMVKRMKHKKSPHLA